MEDYKQTPIIGRELADIKVSLFHENKITDNVSLADYRGKWLVLFFYPADFTFVCPTELEDLASLYEDFKSLNAEVISVSTDTAFVHKAWYDNSEAIGKVNFPMAADPTGRLCKELGTYIPEEGLSLRASFIVNPEGIIKAYEVHDNGIGRSAKELLRKLQAAKFVHEHGDKVCPANWQPGSDTLTPGVDLVGKI